MKMEVECFMRKGSILVCNLTVQVRKSNITSLFTIMLLLIE